MEKQLGWACKLSGVELLGISTVGHSVSQIDGVSDTAPAYWLCGGRLSTGTMASAHLDARHFSLSLFTTGIKLIFTRGHISLTVAFKGPKLF